MRCRIPIIYLVDSAGVNLPYQGGVFPGQYGAARIFYYNSIMRRYLRIPQLAAVMGPCIAGGAYLPALSDVIVMVKGTSFMGLGGPNLVKGATGQTIDAETLGGARDAHRDQRRRALRRRRRRGVPREAARAGRRAAAAGRRAAHERRRDRASHADAARPLPTDALYDLLPADHRMSYDMHARAARDRRRRRARRVPGATSRSEMICGDARIDGIPVGVIANQRGLIKGRAGEKPRFGGIVYAESAEKVAYFIDRCDRQRHSAAVRAGRLRLHGRARSRARRDHSRRRALRRSDGDGARAEDRAHRESRVGRRLLRDGRAGLRSRFHLQLADRPHGGDGRRVGGAGGARPGDRAGEEAAAAARRRTSREPIDEMRADYEQQLDARYAGARGFIDAIVYPEDTRDVLALALRASLQNAGPHLGAFVLPAAPRRDEHRSEAASFASRRARASGATGSRRRGARSKAGRSTT